MVEVEVEMSKNSLSLLAYFQTPFDVIQGAAVGAQEEPRFAVALLLGS